MSKKVYLILLPALLMTLMLGPVAGCAQSPAPPSGEVSPEISEVKAAPTVSVTPAVLQGNSNTKAVIMGSNFEPGQEIRIVVSAQGQPLSRIVSMCKPKPVPDETGAWITVWTFGRYARMLGKVAPNGGEGAYNLSVTDADFNLLTSTPFAIAVTANKPVEEWAEWAQVLLPAPTE
ncbi:hypothetical protein ACFLTZ_05595 [Chloroflexota bacterium]